MLVAVAVIYILVVVAHLLHLALGRNLKAPRGVAVLLGPVIELRLEGLATPPALRSVRDRITGVVLEPRAAFERGFIVMAFIPVNANPLGVTRFRLPDGADLLAIRVMAIRGIIPGAP